ncbi:MAG: TMEM165/GDT1 family protein [Methylohalobius sp. ZOD2]
MPETSAVFLSIGPEWMNPIREYFESVVGQVDWGRSQWLTVVTTLALIVAAEVGDKSQLVCMTLAARHRPWPVLMGALFSFALLNGLAVIFGAAVAAWLPRWLVGLVVAVLFAGFGWHALLNSGGEEETVVVEKSGHGIFFTTFTLILLAEFGDKTQIAVAGLGTASQPLPVWIGATLALGLTSALGVIAGRTVMQRLPIHLIHRISGVLFLILAVVALANIDWQALWQSIEQRIGSDSIVQGGAALFDEDDSQ